MKILFATSECAPFSKSGGLADVAFSLPPALQRNGNETAIITPMYRCVKEKFGDQLTYEKSCTVWLGEREFTCGLYRGERDGVTVWFVAYDDFFDRPNLYGYDDDALRFAFFSKAVVELLTGLDFKPDILHCNDWETALAVIYLKSEQAWRQDLQGIKSVYTIHNMAYQGHFGESALQEIFALPPGWYDTLGYIYEGRRDVNLMKGAMLLADAVSTVSPTYAKELHYPEYGHGLQGVVDMVDTKLYGILNGIDMNHYDPSCDPQIPHHFTADDMRGKAANKAYIQEKFGLAQEPEWPLLCSVARLVEQKGIELVKQVLPGLMDMGVQLIVFGQGEQQYIDYFNWAKNRWPGQLGFSSDYTEKTASEIFAASDLYLMPSRFEPCGLSQMMAMRYGTVPIVRETGGLKDSVRPYSDFDGIGDGFSFADYQAKDLYLAVQEAVKIYFADPDVFQLLRKRCMTKDFSWKKSAQQYGRMYGEIAEAGLDGELSFEEAFAQIKSAYEAIDRKNRQKHAEKVRTDYHRIIQIKITGKGAGILYVEFANGKINVVPTEYVDADAFVESGIDNLLSIVNGTASVGKLFMNGQLKIYGNQSKGFEIRHLLTQG